MYIKLSVNPPPENKEVILLLENGSHAIGMKDHSGVIYPVNIMCLHEEKHEEQDYLEFVSEPIAWSEINTK